MLVEKVARPMSKDPTKKAVTTPFSRRFKNNYFSDLNLISLALERYLRHLIHTAYLVSIRG